MILHNIEMADKPHKINPDDWKCLKCEFVNFSSRTKCMKCFTEKTTCQNNKKSHTKDDWKCIKCEFVNFSSRTKCMKCSTEKTTCQNNNMLQTKPDDWKCMKCEFVNFSSRTKCMKCSTEKTTCQNNNMTQTKPDDWKCIKCEFVNFSSRTKCMKCFCDKNFKLDDQSDAELCLICMTKPKVFAYMHEDKTLHLALCTDCTNNDKLDKNKCIICRQKATALLKVYV